MSAELLLHLLVLDVGIEPDHLEPRRSTALGVDEAQDDGRPVTGQDRVPGEVVLSAHVQDVVERFHLVRVAEPLDCLSHDGGLSAAECLKGVSEEGLQRSQYRRLSTGVLYHCRRSAWSLYPMGVM